MALGLVHMVEIMNEQSRKIMPHAFAQRKRGSKPLKDERHDLAHWEPKQGGGGKTPANNVTCAGKVVQVNPNVRIQSDSNGTITAVGVQLTGPSPYLGTPGGTFVNVPAFTSVGASLLPNGSLAVAVNNPVFIKPGGMGAFTGVFLSSATFSSGSFSQVNGAVAFEGIPFGSKTTPSTFLLNRFNQNSQLTSFAGLLQSVGRLGQQLIGCSVVMGN